MTTKLNVPALRLPDQRAQPGQTPSASIAPALSRNNSRRVMRESGPSCIAFIVMGKAEPFGPEWLFSLRLLFQVGQAFLEIRPDHFVHEQTEITVHRIAADVAVHSPNHLGRIASGLERQGAGGEILS